MMKIYFPNPFLDIVQASLSNLVLSFHGMFKSKKFLALVIRKPKQVEIFPNIFQEWWLQIRVEQDRKLGEQVFKKIIIKKKKRLLVRGAHGPCIVSSYWLVLHARLTS